jgi:hypothetical protein
MDAAVIKPAVRAQPKESGFFNALLAATAPDSGRDSDYAPLH